MSQRIALVLHLDPAWDVEAYQLAGRLTDTPGVRSVEVVPLESGDELMRMSTAKRAVTAGLESWIETDSVRASIAKAVDEYAGMPEPSSDEPIEWPPPALKRIAEQSEERRAELEAARVKERTERTLLEQVERRKELEDLDRRAEEVKRERTAYVHIPEPTAEQRAARVIGPITVFGSRDRAADDPCAGGCSRGGDGPPCGRRGCTG